ncbi:MAG TPA: DUF4410 domain-containing protein [Verrucomicrobiota bacterium]|nr:DUF4410 domain-containing protein [Verrucomicrobiota bacterium]
MNSLPALNRWLCRWAPAGMLAALVALIGCSAMPGEPKTTVTPTKAGSANSSGVRPAMIYVSDFYLNPADIQRQMLVREDGVAGRVLTRVRGDGDPEAKAQQLINVLSQSIVDTLKKAGYRAQRLPNAQGLRAEFLPPDAKLPDQGWLVGGWFTRVDEGNPAMRASAGFGAGSEHVEVQVAVSDLATNAADPFLLIGTENQDRRMPGGLVARNPYAIAAKMVLSRGATERDVRAEGTAIANKLIEYVQQGSPQAAKPTP